MTQAYVGLGSNLGDRVGTLADALRALDETPGVSVTAVSSVYESEPWGLAEQPPFANAVAALDTSLGAEALLAACKRIERRLGRLSGVRFGPRTIDIDVLLFGDGCVDSAGITVPHPRLLERDFVVTPLLEIAPGTRLPDGTPVTAAGATEGRVTGLLAGPPWTG